MGYPIQHIVGFDGNTYDLPTGGSGGLRMLKFSWDGTAGTLTDAWTGEAATLTDDELFLLVGRNYGTNEPPINGHTHVGSQWLPGGIQRFVAACQCAPARITGNPADWWLALPEGKTCLAYYNASPADINILEDQYMICQMSTTQKNNFADYGIKYKDSSNVWTDFSIDDGYYTRSKIFLQKNNFISSMTDLCIGATVGGQSLDSSLAITGAYVMNRSIVLGGITKVYKTIGDGEDSQGCPAYKLCMTSGNEPPYVHGIIIEDACSIIMN